MDEEATEPVRDLPVRNSPRKTIELDRLTRIDPQVLKDLEWDLAFELQKVLRPSVLRELTKREPQAPLWEEKWPKTIAAALVERIRTSNWYVTKLPQSPWHSVSLNTRVDRDD